MRHLLLERDRRVGPVGVLVICTAITAAAVFGFLFRTYLVERPETIPYAELIRQRAAGTPVDCSEIDSSGGISVEGLGNVLGPKMHCVRNDQSGWTALDPDVAAVTVAPGGLERYGTGRSDVPTLDDWRKTEKGSAFTVSPNGHRVLATWAQESWTWWAFVDHVQRYPATAIAEAPQTGWTVTVAVASPDPRVAVDMIDEVLATATS